MHSAENYTRKKNVYLQLGNVKGRLLLTGQPGGLGFGFLDIFFLSLLFVCLFIFKNKTWNITCGQGGNEELQYLWSVLAQDSLCSQVLEESILYIKILVLKDKDDFMTEGLNAFFSMLFAFLPCDFLGNLWCLFIKIRT